jgi:hypothetical protein
MAGKTGFTGGEVCVPFWIAASSSANASLAARKQSAKQEYSEEKR